MITANDAKDVAEALKTQVEKLELLGNVHGPFSYIGDFGSCRARKVVAVVPSEGAIALVFDWAKDHLPTKDHAGTSSYPTKSYEEGVVDAFLFLLDGVTRNSENVALFNGEAEPLDVAV